MEWTVLGTKCDLADLLASVTHIPAAVLRLEQEHTDICIAARMSWASSRETTRPEDEAYCLMGIFDVNMPILYGEGRQAFRRLQEGIMKKTVDTSLFVWGSTWLEPAPPDAASSSHDHVDDASYLLAPAPSAFRECHSVVLTTPRAPHRKNKNAIVRCIDRFNRRLSTSTALTGLPTFNPSSFGVLTRIPVIEICGLVIALLFCRSGEGHQLGLLLHPCSDFPYPAPGRPLFHTGFIPISASSLPSRLITVGKTLDDLQIGGKRVTARWREVYLTYQPPPQMSKHILMNRSIETCFRIPPLLVEELSSHGWETSLRGFFGDPKWTGNPPASMTLVNTQWRRCRFVVWLGTCAATPNSHWANVVPLDRTPGNSPITKSPGEHDCSTDHIADWARKTCAQVIELADSEQSELLHGKRFIYVTDLGSVGRSARRA
ncbi:hypothetical protein C8Q74DRAFT_1278579 [Fomes fomentarius]|nr:hypothetical protein C8Q74DRAFT_1278579 [Fomes fomentarius]